MADRITQALEDPTRSISPQKERARRILAALDGLSIREALSLLAQIKEILYESDVRFDA